MSIRLCHKPALAFGRPAQTGAGRGSNSAPLEPPLVGVVQVEGGGVAPLQPAAAAVSLGLHMGATCSTCGVMLPAEELPEASCLLLGLWGGRGRLSAIVWFPLRDAG